MLEKVKHKGLALAILATAQFMIILDATIVNVALPAIERALGFTTASQLQWVVTAYALALGGFLLLGGRLADLFGRRRIFMTGVALFAAASLIGGFAQNPAMLITLRTIQGLGGALLAPAALSLVLTIFKEGPERNRALGLWSMVAGGGGAVGLLLGGILTQYVNWRWIFFINVPIALGVLIMTKRFVPGSILPAKQRIDYAGAIFVTASLMSLVYGLSQAPALGWGNSTVWGTLLASVALMIAFIINELRVREPLIALSVFRRRNVTGGSIIQLLMPAALLGMFFYLSIYLQQVLKYTPTQTGIADVPFTLLLIAVAGVLSSKIEKLNPKTLLTIAPLIVGAGLVWFGRIPVHSNYWTDILPGIILMASGMAVVFVATTLVTTNGSSPKESGLISGILNTVQQVGGAIGLATLSVVSTSVTAHDLAGAKGDPSVVPVALVHGFQQGFLVAAFFTVATSIVAFTVLKFKRPVRVSENQEIEVEAEAMAALPGV